MPVASSQRPPQVKRRIVVKLGGEIVSDELALRAFARDIKELTRGGIQLVVCHGGGPQLSQRMTALGITPVFSQGKRVTDQATLDVAAMVFMGDVNRRLVSTLNSVQVSAVGLAGYDANLLEVIPSEPDFGFVGEIVRMNVCFLEQLLTFGVTPVIAPLGIDPAGQNYNINADTVATAVAAALHADALILFTNVPGIYRSFDDKESLIHEASVEELKALLRDGSFSSGMIPKVEAVISALNEGVPEVMILDGRVEHALLKEARGEKLGTRVTLTGPEFGLRKVGNG